MIEWERLSSTITIKLINEVDQPKFQNSKFYFKKSLSNLPKKKFVKTEIN